ncbi:MAG: hypothetical protein ACYC6H_03025, partial [Bellilinea sp.]
ADKNIEVRIKTDIKTKRVFFLYTFFSPIQLNDIGNWWEALSIASPVELEFFLASPPLSAKKAGYRIAQFNNAPGNTKMSI